MVKNLPVDAFAIVAFCVECQRLVTLQAEIPFVDSKDVTIFFHADQGSKGLMGQPASAKIYAHTGVLLEGDGPSE